MSLIYIRKIIVNDDIKNKIGFDEKCVTQIVKEFIPESIVRQACYIFAYTYKKSRIRDPSIYFLTLLYSCSQIRKVLEKNKVRANDEAYLIRCCFEQDSYSKISISSHEERVKLTRNAINSVI